MTRPLLTCLLFTFSPGVAGCHLCSASPVLHSAQVVQAGQNVSLTCNLTSSMEVTWYLLRSDKLLPLLTVSSGKIGGDEVMFHTADSRFKSSGALERGPVSLEILGVEEQDAGLYFCIWRCPGYSCVNRGIYLMMNGKRVFIYLSVLACYREMSPYGRMDSCTMALTSHTSSLWHLYCSAILMSGVEYTPLPLVSLLFREAAATSRNWGSSLEHAPRVRIMPREPSMLYPW
uniref:Ig-like domain-containing protein n=1 Tax=Monopterus albus TaxID=43700 RepID=A0A3Q3QAM6_MONAL